MNLKLETIISGPLENNTFLLYDSTLSQGIIFDPSYQPVQVLELVREKKLTITYILFTHGHFDHFAGLAYLLSTLDPAPAIALHPADLQLWQEGGGSIHFRMPIYPPLDPNVLLADNQEIKLGDEVIRVLHPPGHSPGSVVFHIPALHTAIVGDLLFKRSIGRTDLHGGNFGTLKNSIQTRIFTLPPETILLPGHGPQTTVGREMVDNPFVGINAIYNEA